MWCREGSNLFCQLKMYQLLRRRKFVIYRKQLFWPVSYFATAHSLKEITTNRNIIFQPPCLATFIIFLILRKEKEKKGGNLVVGEWLFSLERVCHQKGSLQIIPTTTQKSTVMMLNVIKMTSPWQCIWAAYIYFIKDLIWAKNFCSNKWPNLDKVDLKSATT